MGRGHILRKMSNNGTGGFRQRVDGDVTVDATGGFVKVPYAQVGGSLLASLLVRGGQMQPSVKGPEKRPRGRPRKQTVVDVAAQVWDEVTQGAGVVLADGEPVEVPKALK